MYNNFGLKSPINVYPTVVLGLRELNVCDS